MNNEELQHAFDLLVYKIKYDLRNQPEENKLLVKDYAQEIDRIVRIIKLNY